MSFEPNVTIKEKVVMDVSRVDITKCQIMYAHRHVYTDQIDVALAVSPIKDGAGILAKAIRKTNRLKVATFVSYKHEGVIYVGWSMKNILDKNFSREEGKRIALKRMCRMIDGSNTDISDDVPHSIRYDFVYFLTHVLREGDNFGPWVCRTLERVGICPATVLELCTTHSDLSPDADLLIKKVYKVLSAPRAEYKA